MEFFYALLENDELHGYTIIEINDRPAITGGFMIAGMNFNGFLRDWNKKKLDAEEITCEEYEDWKQAYDPGYWVNTLTARALGLESRDSFEGDKDRN